MSNPQKSRGIAKLTEGGTTIWLNRSDVVQVLNQLNAKDLAATITELKEELRQPLLAGIFAAASPTDLLICLSKVPAVPLVAVANPVIKPVVPAGEREAPAESCPLVISMSEMLDGSLGSAIVEVGDRVYGEQTVLHEGRMVIAVRTRKAAAQAPKV